MKRIQRFLVMLLGICLYGIQPAMAEYYDMGGQEIEIDGYFRQELGWNVNDDSQYNQEGVQSAYASLLFEVATQFGDNWDARVVTRLWANWAYALNESDRHWKKFFGPSRNNHEFYVNFSDIVREAYITYSSTKFSLRLGRQQIGWGESDGLRLMDVVNPLDLRRGAFYDLQGFSEVRIPKWLVKAEYYPDGIGKITDIAIQFIWNPGDVRETILQQIPEYVDHHQNFGGAGNAVTLPNSGGTWAVPHTVVVPFPVIAKYIKNDDEIRNSEFGARVSFTYDDVNMTMNFWHGFSPDIVTDFQKLDYHPLGVMTPMAPVPLAVYHNFIYPRITYAGFTLNTEAPFIGKVLGADSNPVIRIEALYSFDQTLQTNELIAGPAGIVDIDKFMESDQLRYMIGFDWNIRWPWINREKTVFLSGQFFHIHTFDTAPGGFSVIPGGSSYDDQWVEPRDEYYATILLATDYLHEKLSPSILYVENINTNARWCKANLTYKIGSHWRPSIGYLFIDGDLQEHAFALFRERDEISFKIEYLF